LSSEAAEKQLRAISRLDLEAIRKLAQELPERGKTEAWHTLKDRFADSVENSIGGNVLGDSLADAVRGVETELSPDEIERQRWRLYLQSPAFKSKVLELAWIQLEGSIPGDESTEPLDDWV
jgi:hypothetical protein